MADCLIFNKDCMEGLTSLEDESFDIALLDAPYFDYATRHRKDKENKLSQSLVQQDRKDQLWVVDQCIRVLKLGHSFWYFTNWQEAWWFQQRFHSFLHNEIIWYKGNWTAGDLEGSFGSCYEVIFVGVKGSGWKYKGDRLPDIWGAGIKGSDDVLSRASQFKRIHPTEKPVSLYERIIEVSTDENDWILDPYTGSASSAVAALTLNRNFLGYEIDNVFFQRAQERIEKWKEMHSSG